LTEQLPPQRERDLARDTMALLKEIHANAAVAWSPVRRRAELLALGSKGDGGVGFENTGGEFKLVSMDFSDPSTNMLTLGSIKTPSRFTSLAWREVLKHTDTCPYGVVAGGMADGAVTLWNPKAMIDGDHKGEAGACEIGRVVRHKGAVNALQFNPHDDSSHLLASGGSDGEVYIMSLEKLASPGVFTPGGGNAPQQQVNEITSVAWNTQVNYILATGTQNGSTVIWDLKQKKPWCEMRDPQRGTISAIAWNPKEGLQIATASGDDQRPVVKLWDLRNSTSTPLAEFHGHTAGLLSLSWCQNDPGLILSCGKDNKTLLWDLFSRQPMFEFPSDGHSPSMGSDQFFGGGAGQRRWNVQWSPKIPAVSSACTLDGKVQVWGLSGGGNPACRAPRWLRRPAGASFGFGGKLITIANPKEGAAPNADRRRMIHMHRIVSEAPLVAEAEELDRSLESKDFRGHCERKIASATNEKEKSVWNFMKILFEKDARQHLLLHLGLDAEKINALNAKFVPAAPEPVNPRQDYTNERIDSGLGAEDVFSAGHIGAEEPAATPLDTLPAVKKTLPGEDDTSKRLDAVTPPLYTEQSESILMQALLVGNFEVAVNCCLHYNQLADALLLASCGGPELWEKTQRAFFASQQRPVMRVVSAIIKSELHTLVDQSDLSEWRDTLAILSTYAKSEEFPSLCDKLALRLESAGDLHSATLCFMCAVNVEKTVSAWVRESQEEGAYLGPNIALQRLVEKVSIFSQAVDHPDQSMGEEVAARFAEYASLMAAQGRLDIAAKYARFSDISCMILKDRVFHAAPIPGYQPPQFPFEVVQVSAQAQQQPQQGYGKPAAQGYNARNNQYANQQQQQPAHAGASGFGGASHGYQAHQAHQTPAATPAYQTPAATPAYPGRPGYNAPTPAAQPSFQTPQQPGGYGAQPQQPGYNTPAQPSYPGQTAQTGFGSQPSYPGQQQPPRAPFQPPQQNAGFPPQQPAAPSYNAPTPGFGGQAQPGYGAPQQPFPGQHQPGFSGPPSTGGSAPSHAYNAPTPYTPAPAGPAQVPGVNPLTAGPALASSRISKPSVDMNSQKKDGFVSSVGNKELTLKYGNATNAVMSPMANAAQTPQTFNEIIPGSTDKITAQDMPIVNSFNELVAQLQTLPLTMMEQKQLTEIQKSKDLMFGKLNASDLSPSVVAQLHQMVGCFGQRDFGTAQQIYVALTASDWAQHKDWLRGLKSLIHISMKRFR
ncbi:TPA: hypothetical protein N0F65_005920, partial [Lagenidium giganteum]